ncbi:MAG TPA: PIN domain-containing protein [Solirubrobacteraceae bacterium]|nr:PIN domain-containing protein [Solirubrobacteraceae bacterium]
MKRALLDTSFVISLARGEEPTLEDPPQEAAISAVTLCGLHHGVLVATDKQRPGRLATLIYAERRFAALPIDERIAPHYGRLLADVRRRRGRKLHTADALIAATAAAHGLPLITRDRDFAKLDGIVAIIV